MTGRTMRTASFAMGLCGIAFLMTSCTKNASECPSPISLDVGETREIRLAIGFAEGLDWTMYDVYCHHKLMRGLSDVQISEKFTRDINDVETISIHSIKFVISDVTILNTGETGRETYKIVKYRNIRPITSKDNFIEFNHFFKYPELR